jgi:hypothetical protein
LRYASWTGSEWSIENFDFIDPQKGDISMAIDSNDLPHISYVGWEPFLRYASWTGSEWSIENVDNASNVGEYVSLALDSGGHPYISYQRLGNVVYATTAEPAGVTGLVWLIIAAIVVASAMGVILITKLRT